MAWARALLAMGLVAVVFVPAAVAAPRADAAVPAARANTTAWGKHGFDVDAANLVPRSNIVLDQTPAKAAQSMPVGNGVMGASVWAQDGFTA